jgi:hypothetical protein
MDSIPLGPTPAGEKLFVGERLAFCRTLHLNDATIFGHHHVHVGFRGGIFNVFQIAKRFAINDANETAATIPFIGLVFSLPAATSLFRASASATQAPVMDAVRVPPSA